ncbi:hypothetical protein ATO00_14105 [Loigolactobacillus coryniformis subsp. coryniformis]|uniref:Putative transcription regulator (Putative) n=1 Tax=Loigolactobacillus coryniformis subsp. coryniformis KCTC 3167 = DSM 20001 TaxID=913848 RepID=A0A0R1EZL8_9LACO|nr:winged helix-turn-helix transcriptional regulator [Loigolactobacillus coryniformis]ATO56312.1 hypothetical protein LC20001_12080 [Loigolactobacillus coryniformis subsp. coryniformis KCTC 3167 = DSM 20001]KRK14590.1 putative transcription regulator (putative) [Loigolactobacillus coryniformis subsp. coryniformis KCTC 3167 = DSM 20001]OEH89030.1 hypothetical protein ATO00_14105 [Loigolactobacillus coryniformis subsp. coryniformis]
MDNYTLGNSVSLKLLNDKWAGIIIANLDETPSDFMNLREKVHGLSTLNLFNEVSKLNQFNLLDLTEDRRIALTNSGSSFKNILSELNRWGNQHANLKLVAEY